MPTEAFPDEIRPVAVVSSSFQVLGAPAGTNVVFVARAILLTEIGIPHCW